MRFRLRTLMIVVTLAALGLGWPTYALRMRRFHAAEAARHIAIIEAPVPDGIAYVHGNVISGPLDDPTDHFALMAYHSLLAQRYDGATFRPWVFVRPDKRLQRYSPVTRK